MAFCSAIFFARRRTGILLVRLLHREGSISAAGGVSSMGDTLPLSCRSGSLLTRSVPEELGGEISYTGAVAVTLAESYRCGGGGGGVDVG